MKIRFLLFAVFIFSLRVYSQDATSYGPRAGIGYLSNSGTSDLKEGIHSAFGWQVEVPYSNDKLTGYGEAGVMLLGIEQGIIFPHGWAYFGCRYGSIGGGLGPVFDPIGVGLGINIYHQLILEKLRVPIGVDLNFIHGTTRIQLFIGFNYK